MKRTPIILTAVAAAALLGGCASDPYVCPEPSGVTCMSARQVYHLTNPPGRAGIEAAEGVLRDPKTGKLIHPKDNAQFTRDETVDNPAVASRAAMQGPALPLPKPGDVIPIVEPPRVMRIWIGPWVDREGNLHMAQVVYTQIVPRRWSIGTEESPRPTTFFPLDVAPQAPAAHASGGPASTATPSAPAVAFDKDGP